MSGTTYDVVDSSRLVIRDDGTAAWLLAGHECATGQTCSAESAVIDSLSGTYRFGTDSLLIHFTGATAGGEHDVAFTGSVPENVSDDWTGPDVLSLSLSNGAYFGVFKPEE